jgi:hypothetical protein
MSNKAVWITMTLVTLISPGVVWADDVPTPWHPGVIHLNPFIPPPYAGAWPVPPAYPPPGFMAPAPGGYPWPGLPAVQRIQNAWQARGQLAAQAFGGDGNPPDFEYNVVPPFSKDVQWGNDAFFCPPGNWHWEIEIDLNPYNGAEPLPPQDRSPLDGTIVNVNYWDCTGPVPIPLALMVPTPVRPGADIYLDIHQIDTPAELGPFSKTFGNMTPHWTAWGTAVTEDPVAPPQPFPDLIIITGGPVGGEPPIEIPHLYDPSNLDEIINYYDGAAYNILIPEPATLTLLIFAWPLRRKRNP